MLPLNIQRVAWRSFSSTQSALSGHNKWSKIKEKKGINDNKKNAAYTKATREIMTAVRLGGSADPEMNSSLAAVLRRLKDVPKENIQKALDRAVKKRDQRGEDVVYEALACGGKVGLIIECTTDNPNRTIGNIRHILSAHDARIAPVRFMFHRLGLVKVVTTQDNPLALEKLIETAIENGAETTEQFPTDTEMEFRVSKFTCLPEFLGELTTALSTSGAGVTLLASELIFAPIAGEGKRDEEEAAKFSDLVREIEDGEDTKHVWTS
ncbi:YebC-like protein [Mycena galopus ATCC 62051]|nr:YebC-like protein [Mycena galopus ATCC 62051]